MIPLPNIPNFDAPEKPEDDIVLKPVHIIRQDGSNEIAYVQDLARHAEVHSTTHRLHKQLTIVYLVVGTAALMLSAYATVKMLRQKN